MCLSVALVLFLLLSTQEDSSGDLVGDENQELYNIKIYSKGDGVIFEPVEEMAITGVDSNDSLPEGFFIYDQSRTQNGASIGTSSEHFCYIGVNSQIYCWNNFGNQGHGERLVWNLSSFEHYGSVDSIAVGGSHACAIFSGSEGSVLGCWGGNEHGQLGDGTNNFSNQIVIIQSEVGNWTSISAGYSHTCGIVAAKDVYCWGSGNFGQNGADDYSDILEPELVGNFGEDILKMGSGNYHNCVLEVQGRIWCWGWNGYGQLGTGEYDNSNVPVVVDISEVKGIFMGNYHTCARLNNQEVYCWGDNLYGQITESNNYDHPSPVKVSNKSDPINYISTGETHTCLVYEADIHCLGQFEIDEYSNYNNFDEIREVVSGNGYFCEVYDTGRVTCFGDSIFDNTSHSPITIGTKVVPTEISSGSISAIPEYNISQNYNVEISGFFEDQASNAPSSIIIMLDIDVDFGQDSDSDGWKDEDEIKCKTDSTDPESIPSDYDKDGVCDNIDDDDDNDGRIDNNDEFPFDITEWRDDDRDGIGKNKDSFEISPGLRSTFYTSSLLLFLLVLEIYRKKTIDEEE